MTTHLIAKDVGIIEPVHLRQIAAIRRNCDNKISNDWANADEACTATLEYIKGISAGVVNYDATIFNPELYAAEAPYQLYLSDQNPKSGEFYSAIHIDQSTKIPIFNSGSQEVYNAIEAEEYIDWTHFYDDMLTLNGGIDVLVYAGIYDQQDGPLTMLPWMQDLQVLKSNGNKFWKQARKVYYINDGADNSTVGGLYRTDSRFTFLAVPKAGHFVPWTNMAATRSFL